MPVLHNQRVALAAHLAGRREVIMDAWRQKVAADPQLTSGAALPKAQLNDHLPELLKDFEIRLADRGAVLAEDTVVDAESDAAAHGLHRWQQGFDLSEVSRELGRLNECVVAALFECGALVPDIELATLAEAHAIWATLYSVTLGASTEKYFEVQQLEAAGHVADLEQALNTLRQLEVQRAVLWQQAAHDLRGSVGVVAMATAGLTSARAPQAAREKFLDALDRNVRGLHSLLEDVTTLARLQGGQEHRSLTELDASSLLRDIAQSVQAAADEHHLLLGFDGPPVFTVEGDAAKLRRIVQNLVLNAIKFTLVGSVNVHWGPLAEGDTERWFIRVTDTGPGFHIGSGAPLARALDTATEQAPHAAPHPPSDNESTAEQAQPAVPAAASAVGARRAAQPNEGEGIGLSIVKRLCTLLDATLEVASEPGQGTTFRILFPMHYAPAPAPAPAPAAE